MSLRKVMIAWARERYASMTRVFRSVRRAILKNWLPQAFVRSTGHLFVFWIGAATPLTATSAGSPCSVAAHGWLAPSCIAHCFAALNANLNGVGYGSDLLVSTNLRPRMQ